MGRELASPHSWHLSRLDLTRFLYYQQGMSEAYFAKTVEELPSIEGFANPERGRKYEITFQCPEWTAVCPKTGFPDFGTIHIKYVPKESCVELKSLKLYLNAYRTVGIFHEAACNQIMTDLVKAIQPWKMEIFGDFNVRGNIKTTVRVEHRHPEYSEERP